MTVKLNKELKHCIQETDNSVNKLCFKLALFEEVVYDKGLIFMFNYFNLVHFYRILYVHDAEMNFKPELRLIIYQENSWGFLSNFSKYRNKLT
ncbi:hypothetical protein DGG96_19270 [Legionella qingyii]|uniref:Uncharacterized protein n=1 Tax=Legionella qingyii TaxID=2184757 RepID=A0A317TX50_9GAMM|nr:hypothetical protein DGG96_19270 [Legionella qingyii]